MKNENEIKSILEYQSSYLIINRIFKKTVARDPDENELFLYQNKIESGDTVENIEKAIKYNEELKNPELFVQNIFKNFLFRNQILKKKSFLQID